MQLMTKFIESKEGLTMIRLKSKHQMVGRTNTLLLIQGQQYHCSVLKYARQEKSAIALWT